jgi:hypothetical protein
MRRMEAERRELLGWKGIAEHLGVTERTAQDYARKHGLPIHRMPGDRGRVYGYTDELDRWRVGGEKRTVLPGARGEEVSGPEVEGRPWRRAVVVAIALAGVAAALVGGVWWNGRSTYPVEEIEVRDRAVIAKRADDAELWRYSFEVPLLAGSYASLDPKRWALADIDRTPGTELLFVKLPADNREHKLVCFSQGGKVLWTYTPGRPAVTEGGSNKVYPPYFISNLRVFSSGPGQARVVVSNSHHLGAPNQIAVLGQNGKVVGEYWHPGHLQFMEFVDLRHDGKPEMVLAGVNNGHSSATLLTFNPELVKGTSSNLADKRHQLTDFPEGTETNVLLFPRSCVATAKHKVQPYNRVSNFQVTPRGLIVGVVDGVDKDRDPTIIYELSYALDVVSVTPTVSYQHRHNELHLAGLIDHAYSDAEAELLKKRVVYLRR